MIMKRLTVICTLICSVFLAKAQDLESEMGFLYVKADYLLQTDRYEDAILEFNKIIDQNPKFKDALYKRASAKFAIAAFKGTKNDLLLSFDVIGITPESLLLFGQTQKNLNENDAASNTLKTASLLYTKEENNSSVSKKTRKPSTKTRVNEKSNGDEKSTGEKLKDGMNELDEKVNDILGGLLGNEDDNLSDGEQEEDPYEEEVYKPDLRTNEIFIDEDLTIVIKDGLGGRKILQQPNILILSETSGDVTVDVCVDENGKVTSAVFNKDKSTLSTQSLVSLAVRKSKEYWFERSDQNEICGIMIFRITGRS